VTGGAGKALRDLLARQAAGKPVLASDVICGEARGPDVG
jgi:hypothetical protein